MIFDCDGVLVDSEIMSCAIHADVLTRNGYPITADQVLARFLGRSGMAAAREIEAELGRPLPDGYDAELKTAILAQFASSIEATPHIHEALAAIDIPVCVASSGFPEKIQASLTRTGLIDRFAPHIFSAAQVQHGKPAPDLFLFAAAQMHVAPARCVVIEDSVPGVIAARAAGMAVLGFHGGSHCVPVAGRPDQAAQLRAAGAFHTFGDMRQLPALIARIGAT